MRCKDVRSRGAHIALLLLYFAFFCLTPDAHAETATDNPERFQNSVQLGAEYDDNIFKTFTTGSGDGLLKLLLKTQKRFIGDSQELELAVQAGGKKYITHPEQDTAIGQLDFDWRVRLSERTEINLTNIFKGQLESGSQDSALNDINEDFINNAGQLQLMVPFVLGMRQAIHARITYFSFFGDIPIDYVEERFGTAFSRPIGGGWSARAGYDFSLQQFPNSTGNRLDKQHELAAGLRYYGPCLFSLGYNYTNNNSSLGAFSSTGHRVSGLFSVALNPFSSDTERDDDVTLHVLATLQIRQYPAVFVSDVEGQRLLFSDAEDANFNTFTLKLTKRFTETVTGELKYSRYSNEFSDREDEYQRNLYMLGIRAAF